MAARTSQRRWVPKQFPIMDEEWYKTISGSTTNDVARHVFSSILPPLPPNTILHDAAAGQAPFTEAALATCPAASLPSLRLYVSDKNPQMLSFARPTVERHGEEVLLRTRFDALDACDLSPYADGMFTLTTLTFGLPIMPSPEKAAAEMYRTLAVGGTAVSAFWTQQPSGFSLTDAHYAIRDAGRKLKLEPPKESLDPKVHEQNMRSGGFGNVEMHFHTIVLDVPDVRKYVHSLWAVIGEPADGWKQQDEDQWESCIDKGVEILTHADGVTDLGGGHIKVEMIAMIAVAHK